MISNSEPFVLSLSKDSEESYRTLLAAKDLFDSTNSLSFLRPLHCYISKFARLARTLGTSTAEAPSTPRSDLFI